MNYKLSLSPLFLLELVASILFITANDFVRLCYLLYFLVWEIF